jgi:hypothetical protein
MVLLLCPVSRLLGKMRLLPGPSKHLPRKMSRLLGKTRLLPGPSKHLPGKMSRLLEKTRLLPGKMCHLPEKPSCLPARWRGCSRGGYEPTGRSGMSGAKRISRTLWTSFTGALMASGILVRVSSRFRILDSDAAGKGTRKGYHRKGYHPFFEKKRRRGASGGCERSRIGLCTVVRQPASG